MASEKIGENLTDMELMYLKTLAVQYPTIAAASTEIINLQAILNLPKGTEHFLTDIHGEYEQFNHVLKNGSGSVRSKIDEEFGNTLSDRDNLIVDKISYRLHDPERFDIIVFPFQDEENTYYMKRFIGLPG